MPSHRAMWARLQQLERELAADGPVLRPAPGLVVVADPSLARTVLVDRDGHYVPDSAFFRTVASGALAPDVQRRLAGELRAFLDRLPLPELTSAVVTAAHGPRSLPFDGPRVLLEAFLPWFADDRHAPLLQHFVEDFVVRRMRRLPGRWHRPRIHRLAESLAPHARPGKDLFGVIAAVLPDGLATEVFLRTITAFVGAPGAALAWCLHAIAHESADEDPGGHVVRELLRLRPPAWQIGRIAATGHHVGDVEVARGETVVVSTYAMHRHGWDQPERFLPARWSGGHTPPGYRPFGWGPSVCVGAEFSLDLLGGVVDRLTGHVHAVSSPSRTPLVTQLLSPPRSRVQIRVIP